MRPLPSILCLAALWVSWGLAHAGAKEKVEKLAAPPPQPVEQTITVPRHGEAEVTLRIYGSQRETLKFLLRGQPPKGKLTAMVAAGREAALVRYQPPADLGVTTDRFSYAVQSPAGVSAPAEVVISIADEAARLIVPDTLSFGPILAGTIEEKELLIVNAGGGVAEGQLEAEAPWRVKEAPEYRLTEGQQRRFTVVFAPQAGGTQRRELRYTSAPDRVTSLAGEARAPFSVEPATLALESTPGDPRRTGRLEITNGTEADQNLEVREGGRFGLPESVTVPAGGKESLLLQTAPEDVAAVQSELVLNGAGTEMKVPVRAGIAPATLQAARAALEWPSAILGRGAAVPLALRNLGGTEGYWRVEVEAPFTAAPTEVRIPPQGSAELEVRVEAAAPGEYVRPLRLIGEQQTVTVNLLANARHAVGGGSSPEAGITAEPMRMASTTEAGAAEMDSETEAPSGTPGAKFSVRILRSTTTGAVVDWDPSLIEWKSLAAQWQRLSLDESHQLRVEWVDLPKASFRTANGRTQLTVEGLPTAAMHSVRVCAAEKGAALRPLFTLDLVALPSDSWWRFTWLKALIAAALVCGGIVGWRHWRRRRG